MLHWPLPLRDSSSGLCLGDKSVWPGVGSGSSRSQHWALVEQGFEPEGGGFSQAVLPPLLLGLARLPQWSGLGTGMAGGSVLGETDPHSGDPSGPAWAPSLCPRSSYPPSLPPSPTDEPPVPPNQVSLLLHAHSAEQYQLPPVAC